MVGSPTPSRSDQHHPAAGNAFLPDGMLICGETSGTDHGFSPVLGQVNCSPAKLLLHGLYSDRTRNQAMQAPKDTE
jgi:hypothetical protein